MRALPRRRRRVSASPGGIEGVRALIRLRCWFNYRGSNWHAYWLLLSPSSVIPHPNPDAAYMYRERERCAEPHVARWRGSRRAVAYSSIDYYNRGRSGGGGLHEALGGWGMLIRTREVRDTYNVGIPASGGLVVGVGWKSWGVRGASTLDWIVIVGIIGSGRSESYSGYSIKKLWRGEHLFQAMEYSQF